MLYMTVQLGIKLINTSMLYVIYHCTSERKSYIEFCKTRSLKNILTKADVDRHVQYQLFNTGHL